MASVASSSRPIPARAVPPTVPSVQRVLHGALAILSTQPVTWAASLLMVVNVPRYLDAATLGQWTLLIAVGGVAGVVLGLGVPTVLVRRVAAEPAGATRLALTGAVLLGAVALLGALVLIPVIRSFTLLQVPPWTLELALIGLVVAQVQAVLLAVLSGQHRFRRFAWLNALTALATAIASVLALIAGGGLLGLMAVSLVVSVIAVALGWRSSGLRPSAADLSGHEARALIWGGLPFVGSTLVMRLRSDAEVFLLGLLLSVEALGWWSAADRIVFIPLFIPTLLMTPLLPALSAVANDRAAFTHTLRRSLDVAVILTFGAGTAILAIAPAVPSTFGWTPDFAATIPLIELLALVTPLIAVSMVLGTALYAMGEERRWFVVSVIACGAYVLLAPSAIYAFTTFGMSGALGVAVVKLVMETAMIVGALLLLPRGTVDRGSWLVAGKTLVACGAMVLVVRAVLPTSLPLAIAVGALTFPACHLILRTVPPSELGELVSFVRDAMRRRAG